MDSRLFLFLVLAVCFISANARSPTSLDTLDAEGDNVIQIENNIGRNKKLCSICEELTSEAVTYLNENETQVQIIEKLHEACLQMHSFKKQCSLLVDYYTPLFFMELSKISPEKFCEKMNLCEDFTLLNLPRREDACTLCHNIMDEVITKLEDPDTQLEVIEMLLKGCNKMENFATKCKKLVFRYGPLILANAEKFLEATDICTAIHACKQSQQYVSGLILQDA